MYPYSQNGSSILKVLSILPFQFEIGMFFGNGYHSNFIKWNVPISRWKTNWHANLLSIFKMERSILVQGHTIGSLLYGCLIMESTGFVRLGGTTSANFLKSAHHSSDSLTSWLSDEWCAFLEFLPEVLPPSRTKLAVHHFYIGLLT